MIFDGRVVFQIFESDRWMIQRRRDSTEVPYAVSFSRLLDRNTQQLMALFLKVNPKKAFHSFNLRIRCPQI
jgi:hypothetical protein